MKSQHTIHGNESPATVQAVVEACGGLFEVSYQLGLGNNAVRNWYFRGVPRRYWKYLAQHSGLDLKAVATICQPPAPAPKHD